MEAQGPLSKTLNRSEHFGNRQAELLEWIGTAYGRRSDAKTSNDSGTAVSSAGSERNSNSPPLIDMLKAFIVSNWSILASFAVLSVAVSAFMFVQNLQSPKPGLAIPFTTERDSSVKEPPSVSEVADVEKPPAPQEPGGAAKVQIDTKAEPASDNTAEKVAQLEGEISALELARQNAERTAAEERFRLAAERTARQAAEEAAAAAHEKLAHQSRNGSLAPAAATSAPVVSPTNQTVPTAIETSEHQDYVLHRKDATKLSNAAGAELTMGQKLLGAGNLVAARQHFQNAAKLGLPEGAMALGNTFDPTTLAKTGLQQKSDPDRARQWYRLAYTIALRQQ